MEVSVLKPGYLVSLKTGLRGGVSYSRVDIEPDHKDESGARVAKWETLREIPDPDEFELATAIRGKARSLIASVCCTSSFGLLCPAANEQRLQTAVADARKLVSEHNARSKRTQVEVYVLIGRIAQSDEEAARAIGAEIRELLDAMRAGIATANPEAIRDAADKARNLGGMLSADVAGQVSAAIVEARTAAREIVRRVQKNGEQVATVIEQCSLARIESARFAFLDLDEAKPVDSEDPAARILDIAPETGPAIQAAPGQTLLLEI